MSFSPEAAAASERLAGCSTCHGCCRKGLGAGARCLEGVCMQMENETRWMRATHTRLLFAVVWTQKPRQRSSRMQATARTQACPRDTHMLETKEGRAEAGTRRASKERRSGRWGTWGEASFSLCLALGTTNEEVRGRQRAPHLASSIGLFLKGK